MAAEDVQANVVLTADNSQYDQQMMSSAQNTDALGKSIDTLGQKLTNLSKSAGRKMIGFAAADIATITAATVAYGAYEKQMTSLNVQAATLNRTMNAQKAEFRAYSEQVNSIRRTFGDTTGAAAQLVQTVAKMKDGTEPAERLAKTYAQLGQATQESSSQLATSMMQLQRTMGTPQRDTEKLSNQLVTLQARSNSSAEGILNFANSIAPVGRLVNMAQTDVMGFSNAFIKAGQDGYQASNVFNKMLSDIAYATQSGSPELAKYANLVGMTTAQFKELGGTNQILSVFDAINRQGPAAITTLNRMGYDGARTVRTITAMSQQSGGIGSELDAARNAGAGTLNKAQKAATQGLVDDLGKLRAELAQTGESFGKNFAPSAEIAIQTMGKLTSAVRVLVDSPLGKLGALLAGVAAPLALIAGTGMVAVKGLGAIAAIRTAATGATAMGFKETRRLTDDQRQQMLDSGMLPGAGGNRMAFGTQGQMIADRGSWTQRAFYNRGADFARLIGTPSGGPSLGSRLVGYGTTGAAWGINNLITPQFSSLAYGMQYGRAIGGGGPRFVEGPGAYRNVTDRPSFFASRDAGRSFGLNGGFLSRQAAAFGAGFDIGGVARLGRDMVRTGEGFVTRGGAPMTMDDARLMNMAVDRSAGSGASMSKRVADAEKFALRTSESAKATDNLSKAADNMRKSAMNAERGIGTLSKSLGSFAMVMGSSALGAGRLAAGTAVNWGGRAIGALGLNPWMLGIGAGLAGAGYLKNRAEANAYQYQDYSRSLSAYYQAGGIQAPGGANYSYGSQADMSQMTLANARNISGRDNAAATAGSYELQNKELKGKSSAEAEAWLGTQWATLGQSPGAVNAVAMDLTSRFGRSQAQGMLNRLYSGQAKGVGTFATAAIGAGSSKNTGGKLDQFFSSLSNQTDQMAAGAGVDAAMQQRGEILQQNLDKYLAATSMGNKSGKTFDKALAENIFGIKGSELDYGGMFSRRPSAAQLNADTGLGGATDLKEYFQRSFAGGIYGEGTEARKMVMSRLNIRDEGQSDSKLATLVYDRLINPPKTDKEKNEEESAAGQIKEATKELFGASGILGLASVQNALNAGSEDQNAQYRAIQEVTSKLRGQGGSIGSQIEYLMNLNAGVTGDSSMGADIFNASIGMVRQRAAFRAPYQTRTQNFSQAADIFSGTMAANLGPEGMAQREQAASEFAGQVQEQYNYFKQMLYQQREFDISRSRAETDFNLQRSYAWSDFARSRARSEQDYQIMRARAEADFARSVKRNRADFALQRRREEQDHNHQVMLMVEQQAKALYNMYERVNVQRTSSATWLLNNSADQTRRMREQSRDLDTLRRRGLSDDAIQQMGLTDANNQQQLDRFVSETANNPNLIKQFNRQVAERLKAAKNLVTDESSTDWQEFERSFKLARNRAQADFERTMRRARQDFRRSLSQQDEDFKRSLSRQQQDFATSMDRQQAAFKLSMDRSAADLARSAETIDGNFTDILTKAVNKLSGHARRQAKAVLREFDDLKSGAAGKSVDLMQTLADIFGVDYKAPKSASRAFNSAAASRGSAQNTGRAAMASGGVLPGYTPGTDVHHFKSPTAGDLSLSGGEAIMVPEWTKAVGGPGAVAEMNRRARGQRFARGGTFWPVPGRDTGTYSGHDGVDINRGSGWDDMGDPIRAFRAGRISYVGSGKGYGSAIFQSGQGYPTVVYGHTSAQYVKAGDTVKAGQLIGRVGNTGNSSAPHLHFGVPGGTYSQAMALLQGATMAGFNMAMGPSMGINQVLKDRYPIVERLAARMSGVHPLAEGQISDIMNSMAKKAYRRMERSSLGASPVDIKGEPSGSHSNRELVRLAAQQYGWGKQWPALSALVNAESGFRNTAQNPTSTAYGMFQFLDSTWGAYGGKKTSDPWLQAQYGLKYIKERYGNPNKAWAFHQAHNWYGDGALFNGPQTIGVGERGPEAVIPLNDKGTDFMLGLMQKMSVGVEGRAGSLTGSTPRNNCSHVENTYKIDRSTTFSGPITVAANNPAEFISTLQARQRVLALSQPSLGGTR